MNGKLKLMLAAVVLSSTIAFAQQTPNFSQYTQNRYILNPAATGVENYLTGTIGYRKQWAGFGNEPTTFYAGAHKGFQKEKSAEHNSLALRTSRNDEYVFEQKEAETSKIKHGIGGYILSDEYGAFAKNSLNLSYALHLGLTDKIKIAFGANAGFNNMKFDDSKAKPLNSENDPTYQKFVSERNSLSMVDINLGTYLYGDNFFVGYSTNQLAGDKISFGNTSNSILSLHHGLIGGYTFEINENINLTPSTYVKLTGGAPLSMDLNLRADIQEKYFGGISYRNQDAIVLMAGITLKEMFMISYSYDINTSPISSYSSGGHEIVLGIMLK